MPNEEREIVEVEHHTQSKDVAYSRTMRWIAENYNSAQDVIQYKSQDEGAIIIKALTPIHRGIGNYFDVRYTLSMGIKDERIRFKYAVGDLVNAYNLSAAEGKTVKDLFHKNIKPQVMASIERKSSF